mmetsp:Transcript_14099/g.32137  ORF Transcript_14099/g.32137 Transcript_14099/m.32137 type:complete len:235 (+) Transcript_14099:65-769(+)
MNGIVPHWVGNASPANRLSLNTGHQRTCREKSTGGETEPSWCLTVLVTSLLSFWQKNLHGLGKPYIGASRMLHYTCERQASHSASLSNSNRMHALDCRVRRVQPRTRIGACASRCTRVPRTRALMLMYADMCASVVCMIARVCALRVRARISGAAPSLGRRNRSASSPVVLVELLPSRGAYICPEHLRIAEQLRRDVVPPRVGAVRKLDANVYVAQRVWLGAAEEFVVDHLGHH